MWKEKEEKRECRFYRYCHPRISCVKHFGAAKTSLIGSLAITFGKGGARQTCI